MAYFSIWRMLNSAAVDGGCGRKDKEVMLSTEQEIGDKCETKPCRPWTMMRPLLK